jgi:hypothetical protein
MVCRRELFAFAALRRIGYLAAITLERLIHVHCHPNHIDGFALRLHFDSVAEAIPAWQADD